MTEEISEEAIVKNEAQFWKTTRMRDLDVFYQKIAKKPEDSLE